MNSLPSHSWIKRGRHFILFNLVQPPGEAVDEMVEPDIQGVGRGHAREKPSETQPQSPAAHTAICKP